ncbi:hypothetical protein BDK51DRAFT_39269 [Blyttiomyces helicus]|uniref:Uncharacterized protein n=1 Tax=Blyttiomyces helicus TaxID=388810 RepID=A0A4P9VUU3_9FUNG|nr:hypothetical protein BDK51DRAFT_39269 [Blyttiomyces helicus]|eukprot:RKO83364.1 hypothetical protein BDK51DRAFT_39269 [Blyttiomyces helicus]
MLSRPGVAVRVDGAVLGLLLVEVDKVQLLPTNRVLERESTDLDQAGGPLPAQICLGDTVTRAKMVWGFASRPLRPPVSTAKNRHAPLKPPPRTASLSPPTAVRRNPSQPSCPSRSQCRVTQTAIALEVYRLTPELPLPLQVPPATTSTSAFTTIAGGGTVGAYIVTVASVFIFGTLFLFFCCRYLKRRQNATTYITTTFAPQQGYPLQAYPPNGQYPQQGQFQGQGQFPPPIGQNPVQKQQGGYAEPYPAPFPTPGPPYSGPAPDYAPPAVGADHKGNPLHN